MPLFNPKTLEAALRGFDFKPSDTQQESASRWAKLMRDEFLLRQKETALEADFKSIGKLENWAARDFAAFRAVIKEVFGADIPISERDGWERYFNARKAEVVGLSGRIAGVEAEINERMYRVFDLDRDEIALIEEEIQGQY
jgi:hypothetical protein